MRDVLVWAHHHQTATVAVNLAQDSTRLADAIGRPYPWRLVLLRATLAVPVTLIAAKYAVGTLAPNAADQLGLARAVVVGLLALYAGAEFALWWRRRRRKA